LVEQSNELLSALYLLFIDFEKAFDSTGRDQIWIEIKNYGIPPKIIKLIHEPSKIILAKLYTTGNLIHLLRQVQVYPLSNRFPCYDGFSNVENHRTQTKWTTMGSHV
jgi:hypothetical protein